MLSPVLLSILKVYLASDELSKSFAHRSPDMTSARGSNFESYVATISCESFAFLVNHLNSSRAGIVERHILCAQSTMHLAESAAPSGSSRLQSSINFGSTY